MTTSALKIFLKIQSETAARERDLNDAMDRLGNLGRQIEALKTKRANNSLDAARAEETATMARDKASEAKEVCGSHLFVTVFCLPEFSNFIVYFRSWTASCPISTVLFRV